MKITPPTRPRAFANLNVALADARLVSRKWSAVCDQITRYAGGVGTVFAPLGGGLSSGALVNSPSLNIALQAYRADGWYRFDPRQDLTDLMRSRGYALDADLYAHQTLERLPFYTDFLQHHGLGGFCGFHFKVGQHDWYGAVQFATGRYQPRKGFLEDLPHIQQALSQEATHALRAARGQWQAIQSSGTSLGMMMLPLDATGKICADRVAPRVEMEGDQDLLERADDVAAMMSADLKHWLKSGAAEPPAPRRFWSNDKQSFACFLRPAPESMRFFALGIAGILCIARTQNQDNQARFFSQSSGLTPAETRVVEGLCDGKSVKDISQEQQLKEGTVRQQLKSVFRKTNTSSQHQLVASVFNKN